MSQLHTRTFAGRSGSVTVHHTLITAEGDGATAQLADLRAALTGRLPGTPVYARIMVSDAANQAESLSGLLPCPCSVIEQCPQYRGTKFVALVLSEEGRGPQSPHRFMAGMTVPAPSREATEQLLRDYAAKVPMAGECVRTWFFVNDIDNNYAGMVQGRNNVFADLGLTADTHFIASTGIAGRGADHRCPVTFDAYSIDGLSPRQVTYLTAPTHLNSTIDYGVAFERATAVDFTDRRMILVSGTASINNKGEIVHPGDIKAQCRRMVENVAALLAEGGAGLSDVLHAVVYVRDPADAPAVEAALQAELPTEAIRLIVHAPVCRPGWLVEMECMAFVSADNPDYPEF